MGTGAGRRRIEAVSQHLLFTLIFAGATCSLGGVKQHAEKRSEKVRRLWAGSASESKVLCSNSVRRFPVGFVGAVQAAFGVGWAIEVSWGGRKEQRGVGDFSQAQW